jgi:hypothetical protein
MFTCEVVPAEAAATGTAPMTIVAAATVSSAFQDALARTEKHQSTREGTELSGRAEPRNGVGIGPARRFGVLTSTPTAELCIRTAATPDSPAFFR